MPLKLARNFAVIFSFLLPIFVVVPVARKPTWLTSEFTLLVSDTAALCLEESTALEKLTRRASNSLFVFLCFPPSQLYVLIK